jgi:ribokinase
MSMPSLLVCGAVNWDTTLFVDNLPRPGEELRVNRVISVPGGKGGNTAVAAARILGKNQVGIVGMLGSDKIADMQHEILLEEGVDVSCLARHDELASGQAHVVVDRNGENMILTHRAANAGLSRESIRDGGVATAIESSNTLVVIDPPIEIAFELAMQAKKHGKSIVLSPAMLVNHGFSALKDLLQASDYIILNEHESRSLASAEEGVAACEELSSSLGGKPVITTLGSRGCILCQGGRKKEIPTMDLASLGLKVVSTVGAGDTFEGAFASFKIKGLADIEAAFLANVAAALKITREQTRGSPSYEEIERYAESDPIRATFHALKLT